MLDDASPRGWSFHESFAAYHEPASTRIPLHEDVFTVRTSRPSRPSAAAAASARLDRISPPALRHPPAPPPAGSAPARRAMYDPVRDSACSRPSNSPAHARPAADSPRPQYASEDEDRKPSLACQTCSVPHDGDCIPTGLWLPSRVYEGEQDRTLIVRKPARTAYARRPFTAEELEALRLPPISTPQHQAGIAAPELRPKLPRGRHPWEHDRRSNKRAVAEVESPQDRRSPPCTDSVQPSPYLDIKGKRKMMSLQSPAFRLDNLLEPSPLEASQPPALPSPAIGGSHEPLSEPVYTRAPSMPVFAGKLPPTPFTGSSALGSATHTSIGDLSLGITVSKDVNLDAFAVPDDFERDALTSAGVPSSNPASFQPGSFASSSRLPAPAPNAKPPRKLHATSQRRKSRGLFPHDDVPLVISSSTTKQSRYRPSGDRQPVACGYKDPITQVQCDEPFNRPVELRRHVRAVHVPAEALAVTMGQLSRSQATLLPNDWKPGDGDVLRPTCTLDRVNAKVVDGKCVECPSSLAKKKDRYGSDQVLEQGSESIYGTPGY
ncbi:C2H2 zinc finger [Ceratobasidium sp. AG-Ba]|nr:C2H2 zinc finger [Ceratobasidium sp. AG-Ba]